MQVIRQKLVHSSLLRPFLSAALVVAAILAIGGTAFALPSTATWNKDGSLTYNGKVYSAIIGEANGTQNAQLHIVQAKDKNSACPSSAIYFAVGANLKTAKSATYVQQIGGALCTSTGKDQKITFTNKRPGPSQGSSDPLTNKLTSDGTQQAANNYNACDKSSPGFQPDSALCSQQCSSASNCDLIKKYVNPIINKFLAPMAVLAVIIGLIWGGIQYSTSGGDSQKVATAKGRIQKSLLALVAFILLYTFLNWLIPGGLV